uniref:Uncharacterized protein n=1 Tax=viral metagenome TaxID=1070528 RepID=A0A6C0B0H6_9ZZZZ
MPSQYATIINQNNIKHFILNVNRPSNIPDTIVTDSGLEVDIQHSIHSIHKEAFVMTRKFAEESGLLYRGFPSETERISTILFLKYRKNCKWIENLTYYAMTYGEYVDSGDDIDTSERLQHVRDKIRHTLLEFICYNKPSLCVRNSQHTATTISTNASTPLPRSIGGGIKNNKKYKTRRVKKSNKKKSYRKIGKK